MCVPTSTSSVFVAPVSTRCVVGATGSVVGAPMSVPTSTSSVLGAPASSRCVVGATGSVVGSVPTSTSSATGALTSTRSVPREPSVRQMVLGVVVGCGGIPTTTVSPKVPTLSFLKWNVHIVHTVRIVVLLGDRNETIMPKAPRGHMKYLPVL